MYLLIARITNAGRRLHPVVLAAAFTVLVLVGAAAFAATQGITFGAAVYWAITTATTVGYGDVTPHNPAGRVIASLLMLTAIPMLGALFARAAGVSVAAGLRRIMNHESAFPAGSYRLVLGDHPTVPAILAELSDARDAVVLVADVDPATVPETVHLVRGDPTDPAVIRRARPAGAQHALVTATSDGDVLVSAILLREQAPDLPIAAMSNSGSVRDALRSLGVHQTLSVDVLVAHTLAKALETPHAGDLIEQLVDSDGSDLVEIAAEPGHVGRNLSAVRRDHGGLVLGIVRGGTVSLGVTDDPAVAEGDRLLIAVASREPARS